MSEDPAAFDAFADDYEAQLDRGISLSGEGKSYFAEGRLEWLEGWWRRHRSDEPKAIIDYGCGVGDVTALLKERWPAARVLGLDPSSRSIDRARAQHGRPGLDFGVIAAEGEPEAAGAADLIHVNGVVHHVPLEEREGLFARLTQLLAPQGVLALFENNPLNPGTHLVMARIPFDRDAIKVPPWEARRRTKAAGLRHGSTGYLFYFPRSLRFLRPVERMLTRLPLGAQYGVAALIDDGEVLARFAGDFDDDARDALIFEQAM